MLAGYGVVGKQQGEKTQNHLENNNQVYRRQEVEERVVHPVQPSIPERRDKSVIDTNRVAQSLIQPLIEKAQWIRRSIRVQVERRIGLR